MQGSQIYILSSKHTVFFCLEERRAIAALLPWPVSSRYLTPADCHCHGHACSRASGGRGLCREEIGLIFCRFYSYFFIDPLTIKAKGQTLVLHTIVTLCFCLWNMQRCLLSFGQRKNESKAHLNMGGCWKIFRLKHEITLVRVGKGKDPLLEKMFSRSY